MDACVAFVLASLTEKFMEANIYLRKEKKKIQAVMVSYILTLKVYST